mmetsp:Transcript_11176/g.33518  ORF Transcript_11176/g.33518 Transcript_11176/m.33518 type:complete len:115 (-) Transcript_11176:1599-1943(-)
MSVSRSTPPYSSHIDHNCALLVLQNHDTYTLAHYQQALHLHTTKSAPAKFQLQGDRYVFMHSLQYSSSRYLLQQLWVTLMNMGPPMIMGHNPTHRRFSTHSLKWVFVCRAILRH